MNILAHLRVGGDAARSIGDIAEDAGVSRREVEKTLEALVKSGVPVVAATTAPKGVYLAQTAQEARDYAQSLRGRIVAVQARISALERWADERESGVEQTELWAA